MNPIPEKVLVVKDSDGNEAVTIRVDKTARDMMEAKPSGRWGGEYWEPKYDFIYETFRKGNYETIELGNDISHITDGNRGERLFSREKKNVIYIQATNMVETGLDFTHSIAYIDKKSWLDPARSRVKINDILLGERGVASTGRVVVIHKDYGLMNISQIIALIRLKSLNPYYVGIFLKSKFGKGQIKRLQSGIGPAKLVFDEIRSIKIPILPEEVQRNIESEYKKMSAYHDKAMDAKSKGDEVNYKKNIATAEKMLRDLIARTESIIRGEKDDIV